MRKSSVRVWLICLDHIATPEAFELLQADERSECARFINAQDQCAFAVTRAALRCLLGDEIGIAPCDVRLVRNQWGKPLLAPAQHRPGLDFSVSHAGDLSVIALSSGGPVGVDIERRHHVSEMRRIATEVFGDSTALMLDHLPPSKRDEAFLRLWTTGEACLKAMGLGFAGAGGRAPVRFSRQGSPEISLNRAAPGDNDEWAPHSLELPREYVGAVVARQSAIAARFCTVQRTADLPRITTLPFL